jgi:hypothetical protein
MDWAILICCIEEACRRKGIPNFWGNEGNTRNFEFELLIFNRKRSEGRVMDLEVEDGRRG